MQPRSYSIVIARLLAAGILAAGLVGCDRRKEPASSQSTGSQPAAQPTLAASVFPIADLVDQVAGNRWRVVTLLPPGRNPHGYALRPSEAEPLVHAKVVFTAGRGLDGWAVRAAHGMNEQAKVIVLTESLGLGDSGAGESATNGATKQLGDGHEDDAGEASGGAEHAHGGMDPHIWLDPQLAGRIADLAAEELTRLDPAGRETYQANLASLKQKLAKLDEEYRQTLSGCRIRTLVVFHPGYGYLARRYDLEQVPIVTGGSAKPAAVEQIAARIQQENIRAVYREPQFESKWVEFISRRTGAKVLVLDPQGHAGKVGYDSYFAMMRSNLAALKEGLDCGQ